MGTFYLKVGDTTTLETTLKDPDLTVHDLTGKTINLNIWLSDGTKLTRAMVIQGAATNGVVRYIFVAGDWVAGQLVASPTLPLKPGVRDHRMEYEAVLSADVVTFPNDGYDTLRITAEAD